MTTIPPSAEVAPSPTPSNTTLPPVYEPAPTPTPTPMTTTPPMPTVSRSPRIMLIGDSITSLAAAEGGFTSLLQASYGDTIEVLNRGRSGYNTELTLSSTLPDIANDILADPAPRVITVWLGNNDAALIGGNYQVRHVTIDKFKQNLVTILVTVRQLAPLAKLVLISPSVIDNATRRALMISRHLVFDPLDRTNEQAGLYAAACREIAALTAGINVSMLDIYEFFMTTYPNTTERATLLQDGLHYSTKGHREVFEQLQHHFKLLVPSVFNTTDSL